MHFNKFLKLGTCLLAAGCTRANISFDVQKECSVAIQENVSLVNVVSLMKLKGSDSEKLLSMTCDKDKMQCLGAELRIPKDGKKVGLLHLNPQIYEPDQIDITNTISTIKYRNTVMNVDLSSQTVKLAIEFDREKPTVEYWEGSCK